MKEFLVVAGVLCGLLISYNMGSDSGFKRGMEAERASHYEQVMAVPSGSTVQCSLNGNTVTVKAQPAAENSEKK